MRDIVERLNYLASGQDDPHSVALTEAAAEIDRLRAENDALLMALQNSENRHTYEAPAGMVFMPAATPDEIERLTAERDAGRDLMAVVHGDGGHYREKHGDRKAADDAIAIVYALRAERDAAVADAERYRWLRDDAGNEWAAWADERDCPPDEIDAAIDRARREQK